MMHRRIVYLLGYFRFGGGVGLVRHQCWNRSNTDWIPGHAVDGAKWGWPWGAIGGGGYC